MRRLPRDGVGNIEGVASGPCSEELLFSLNRMDHRFFGQRLRELFAGTPFGCRVAWEEIPYLQESDIPALSALYHQWFQGAACDDCYIRTYLEHAWNLAPSRPDRQSVFPSMVVCPADKRPNPSLLTFYVDVTPWRDGDSIRGVNLIFKHCMVSETQSNWAQHFFASWGTERKAKGTPYSLLSVTNEEAYERLLGVPPIRMVLEKVREQAFEVLVTLIAAASDVRYSVDRRRLSPHCPSINNTALLANLRQRIPDVDLIIAPAWGIAPSPEDGDATTDSIYTGFDLPRVESYEGMTRMTTLCAPDRTGDLLGFRKVGVRSDHAMVANVYDPQGNPMLHLALPFSCGGALR